MIYFKLLYVFFIIGLFSFGGGLAMLPLIKEAVFKNNWLTHQEFLDIISISQVTPGPIAVNTATFVGHKVGGILGSLVATLGVSLPSLIIIIIVASIYNKLKNNEYKNAFFFGVKPVTVGLIAYAGYIIGKPTFISGNHVGNIKALGIFLITFLLMKRIKINPVVILIISGILGALLF
ncbi:MAG: chromate transporter [Cetobacterium sp.]|uniref:Chromate transporter n=1 Tax=Cetobacterium ceti TaxID=180163 RepID=A0A1T4LH62_9FUSO|nr:chromate transporter [Cetobacterium ceti]MCJ8342886.1 chromate transporter [Cetobacterium sp.]SJZ53877.1 chromate transporter [Cetobacterium ceti]